jgi:hypothetical protein
VSQITLESGGRRIDTYGPDVLLEVDMIAKRDYHYWRAVPPAAEWQGSDKPYELVTICLWSVVAVALSAFLMWLALGGQV